jgi:hypothetical protein
LSARSRAPDVVATPLSPMAFISQEPTPSESEGCQIVGLWPKLWKHNEGGSMARTCQRGRMIGRVAEMGKQGFADVRTRDSELPSLVHVASVGAADPIVGTRPHPPRGVKSTSGFWSDSGQRRPRDRRAIGSMGDTPGFATAWRGFIGHPRTAGATVFESLKPSLCRHFELLSGGGGIRTLDTP